MFSTLFKLFKTINYSCNNYKHINIWPFFNSNIFYYKLQNKIIFFTNIYENLKINKILIFKKYYSFIEIFIILLKFLICIIIFF